MRSIEREVELNPPIWFERKFHLDIPIETFPYIVERLRGTPARLEDRLLKLSHDLLITRRGDRWSIQEHAGHLLDLEALGFGRLDDFEANLESLRAANLQNTQTFLANHNERPLSEILAEFREERFAFVERIEDYDSDFHTRTALHPRLKQPMRLVDLAFFIAEHDDHHLAKITAEIRQS